MKLTFLHLSDLHYRTAWPEENDLVCEQLFKDLAKRDFDQPYLVFSGDLVFAGSEPHFYKEFDAKFNRSLCDIGIPKERRICVPGNHDLSRAALKPVFTIQKGSFSEVNDERSFNDNFEQFSNLFLAANFNNYKAHESQFASHICCNSGLGGSGWELSGDIGVYCLNTALCSFGGIDDINGKPIDDKHRLMVETRSLYRWLNETKFRFRILVMHHPLDWLIGWAKAELETIIHDNFQLIFSGHVHANQSTYSSNGIGSSLNIVAPPLFTRKNQLLGYSIVTHDTERATSEVTYRQWSPSHRFVPGTSLAGNEDGKLQFSLSVNIRPRLVSVPQRGCGDTLGVLQSEFDEARTSYSSKKQLWVDRDLANVPETSPDSESAVFTRPQQLATSPRSCVIRSPKQFGLSCLGRFLALEHHRDNVESTLLMLDMGQIPHHRQGIIGCVNERCRELQINQKSIAGFILDNWNSDKSARRTLREIIKEYPGKSTIILAGEDDFAQIANTIEVGDSIELETLYLWALTRSRIRDLTTSYIEGIDNLDEDLVTKKVTGDIDALNIHRTPLNCLLLLKLSEQAFDDSPVNRTEMIGRVLYLLFYQYNQIPRYATRPDLKDCEFALGYFCETLIRSGKKHFSKNEFFTQIQAYCTRQILDLDVEVLFSFLATENILVRKGNDFEFRFIYWLYFFAAHRMHHDADFADYILSDRRYAAFPEIIEFYTGIDRMCSDAVVRLTKDLDLMDAEFLRRSGIPPEFSPFQSFQWAPSEEAIKALKQQMADALAESALPDGVKDAIADKNYNRAKPYDQVLANYISASSLAQMVEAMKAASRALRNSDHVHPSAKSELLERISRCWIRVCQTLAVLSPVLAAERWAAFEGYNFFLDKTFEIQDTSEKRWKLIMSCIVDNVIDWYHVDIFSKKLGALFVSHIRNHSTELGELLLLLVMVRQRPQGWDQEVERFIVRENKNSFALNKIFSALRREFRVSFASERTRQQLRRLGAMAIAKHSTGSKHPNASLVEKAAKALEEPIK